MSTEKDWNQDQILKLIDLVQQSDNIWNPQNILYRNRIRRTDSINEIANILGVSQQEVDKKWKTLQSQFRREQHKVKNKKSGAGTDDNYTSAWYLYKPLSFLSDRNKPKNTRDTYDAQVITTLFE
ncbi:uncharacterized protein LOC132934637 [Metopolophium dirhodum]|uniref:uncharacterized protein LOC132933909 n=1 Tax=Metopolophium dirhodum TaxID=44670 RepID=UPI002990550B|nr:uncharacterized protein LOC132933909 [Metopolophium dirhodum]XP_060856947.1 uncharacterized protein LOC132934637 [Metopolophium dirhodum]